MQVPEDRCTRPVSHVQRPLDGNGVREPEENDLVARGGKGGDRRSGLEGVFGAENMVRLTEDRL
ncbi:hypothetical protein, partial [Streptomyces sp. NPDC003036]|uniref:hypothetical protein n=1 Tax=Streptomyces sp. NPDC003036 TaxID=3154442 RepID=UPI0033A99548